MGLPTNTNFDPNVGLTNTPGGPRAANSRWSAYIAGGGLRGCASHRNDPLANDVAEQWKADEAVALQEGARA